MKKMWTHLAILLFMCAVALPALAQNEGRPQPQDLREMPTPEKIARGIADKMKATVGLSDKQYNKVYKLYYKTEKKLASSQSGNQNGPRPPMGMGGGMPPQGGFGGGDFGGGDFGGMPPQGGFGPGADDDDSFGERSDKANDSMAKREAAMQKLDKKLKKILSEQQYTSWKEIQAKEQADRQKEHGGERGHGPQRPPQQNVEK